MTNESRRRCGTPSGYVGHRNKGEQPCPACAQARSDYDKRLQTAPRAARRSRLSSRAQAKAYGHLARLYPEVYRSLYAEAKAEIYAEEGEAL